MASLSQGSASHTRLGLCCNLGSSWEGLKGVSLSHMRNMQILGVSLVFFLKKLMRRWSLLPWTWMILYFGYSPFENLRPRHLLLVVSEACFAQNMSYLPHTKPSSKNRVFYLLSLLTHTTFSTFISMTHVYEKPFYIWPFEALTRTSKTTTQS